MPIYRGATKVTPRRGDKALARVYRGSTLVWEAAPAYPISGVWEGGTVPDAGNPSDPDLYLWLHEHAFTSAGTYRVQWEVTWTRARLARCGAYGSVAWSPWGSHYVESSSINFPSTRGIDRTHTFAAGDTLRFYCASGDGVSTASGGTWSIEKLD